MDKQQKLVLEPLTAANICMLFSLSLHITSSTWIKKLAAYLAMDMYSKCQFSF